jgi:hypothetical protein
MYSVNSVITDMEIQLTNEPENTLLSKEQITEFQYGLNIHNQIVRYDSNNLSSAFVDCINEILEFGVWTITQGQKSSKSDIKVCTRINNVITFDFINISSDVVKFIKDNKVFEKQVKTPEGKVLKISNIVAVSEFFKASFNSTKTSQDIYEHDKGICDLYEETSKEFTSLHIVFILDSALNIFSSNEQKLLERLVHIDNIIRMQLAIFKALCDCDVEFILTKVVILNNERISNLVKQGIISYK